MMRHDRDQKWKAERARQFVVDWVNKDALAPDGDPAGYKLVQTFFIKSFTDGSYDSKQIEQIVEKAKQGHRLYQEMACEIAAEMLRVGEVAPTLLSDYIAKATRPPGRPGVSPNKNYFRDLEIEEIVTLVRVLGGFKLTRNPATRSKPDGKESACSIVAQALEMLGCHMSEDAVKESYDQGREIRRIVL
jgi:hypothetical protein